MHHTMEEVKKKTKELGELKEKLMKSCCTYMDQGLDKVDTKELGEAIDMIKDLAEAECKCWEAMYYCSVVSAMEEASDEQRGDVAEFASTGGLKEGPWGYDHWRYPSSGRFAPTGHGTRMGYSGNGNNSGNSGSSSGSRSGAGGRNGYSDPMMDSYETGWGPSSQSSDSYDRFREARRHYTETKSKADKDEMTSHGSHYLAEAEASIRDIWKDADPELKKRMKQDLQQLVGEMQI